MLAVRRVGWTEDRDRLLGHGELARIFDYEGVALKHLVTMPDRLEPVVNVAHVPMDEVITALRAQEGKIFVQHHAFEPVVVFSDLISVDPTLLGTFVNRERVRLARHEVRTAIEVIRGVRPSLTS